MGRRFDCAIQKRLTRLSMRLQRLPRQRSLQRMVRVAMRRIVELLDLLLGQFMRLLLADLRGLLQVALRRLLDRLHAIDLRAEMRPAHAMGRMHNQRRV